MEDPHQIQMQFLSEYANPEFNNMSGIFTIYHDLGYAAFIYFALVGIMLGITYKSFRTGNGYLGYYYPLAYVVILELIRVSYLTSTRMFPIIIFTVLAVLFTRGFLVKRT
jgi:hypothetical protein